MTDEPRSEGGRRRMPREADGEGIVEELIDDLLPERLDWRRLVRDYPIPTLLVAAAGGYYLGRRHGSAVLASLSGLAADEVGKRVALFTEPERGWPAETHALRDILHLSDVHFGPPHLPRVSQGVVEMVAARRPDLVVLSGDLTQRAKPLQFQQARAFVDRILELGVPVLTVPGNHDVPLYRVWERVFDPYGAYRRHFGPELEPTYQDAELLVVGINTAHGWTLKDGRIPLRKLLELERLLAAAPESQFKVVVAHHHLIPPPNFGTQSVLTNAYEAIDLFSSAGVDLILSGHLHQAYIGSSEEFYPKRRKPVVILHSGTSTSNRGRGGEKERNTCNWIRVGPRTMVVSHLRWHGEEGAFLEQSRHWYPRQEVVPYALPGAALPELLG